MVGTNLFNNNNTVIFVSAFTMTLNCPMNFTLFPFDTQRCKIEMGLPEDVTTKLDLDVSDSLNDYKGYNMQVCLCIISFVSINSLPMHCGKVLPSNKKTSSIAGFTLEMERKPTTFAFLYILPSGRSQLVYSRQFESMKCSKASFCLFLSSALFVVVSEISFLIPPSAYPARCGLLLTTLLVRCSSIGHCGNSKQRNDV